MTNKENILCIDKHILMCLDEEQDNSNTDLEYLKKNFCGVVFTGIQNIYTGPTTGRNIYICGDIGRIMGLFGQTAPNRIYIIKELSRNFSDTSYKIIDLAKVPINF